MKRLLLLLLSLTLSTFLIAKEVMPFVGTHGAIPIDDCHTYLPVNRYTKVEIPDIEVYAWNSDDLVYKATMIFLGAGWRTSETKYTVGIDYREGEETTSITAASEYWLICMIGTKEFYNMDSGTRNRYLNLIKGAWRVWKIQKGYKV